MTWTTFAVMMTGYVGTPYLAVWLGGPLAPREAPWRGYP